MTQTGYQDIIFTEINPASTTTAIAAFYNPGYYQSVFTLGPVTIISNAITRTTPTATNLQPTTVTVVPTVTVDSIPTTVTSSSTLIQPSCELIFTALSLIGFLGWYCL